MCSIAGFMSKEPLDAYVSKRLASALLWYGQERGQHSAGCYVNGQVVKDAVHPSKFIESKAFNDAFNKGTSLVLCHTRQPTSGGREALHAQPFIVGSTVTVHNGMLWDCEKIKQRWELKKKSNVDSELFTRFIDSYGVLRLPEFVECSAGNTALAALQGDKLYLFRDNNPIQYISFVIPQNEILAFASTAGILMSALKNIWLMPPSLHTSCLDDGILHVAEPSGVQALTKKRVMHNWQQHGSWKGFDPELWEREGNVYHPRYRPGESYSERCQREDTTKHKLAAKNDPAPD